MCITNNWISTTPHSSCVCFSLSSLDVLNLIRQRKKGSAFVKVEMIMVKTTLIKWSFVGYERSKKGIHKLFTFGLVWRKIGQVETKTPKYIPQILQSVRVACKKHLDNMFQVKPQRIQMCDQDSWWNVCPTQ